ncbi:two-component sensor histidine kinase [Sphaerisporangium album]|uniref:histidine kinase n=1 Tax=Sphaerisporangium album TaxID=509200 RepID=A0A367FAZ2_9ACTN|nr:histidine kinase [Sphaerisporangium album]RCG26857.1 two-component sensor histidine kinase [Sphaerisporangium album]
MTDRLVVVRRMRRAHWVAVDAVAALLLAVAFGAAALAGTGPPAVAVAAALPVAARRLWPAPMLVTAVTAVTAGLLAGVEALYLPLAVILYTVGAQEPRRRAVMGLVLSLAAVAAALGLAGGSAWSQTVSAVTFSWLVMGLPWTVGLAMGEQRSHAARAARQSAERAVADERLRIARELHDVVAHSMSLITMRAGVAGLVAETRPREAREALRLIEVTGRAAMGEIRAALGMLRSEPGQPGTRPAPRLTDLHALAARAAVRVDLSVDLDAALSEGLELTVYRIVQEALTNVVKHSGSSCCRVRVTSPEPGVVEVEVTDDGEGLPGAGGGHGLAGMRERCLMYGGSLTAGPRPDGGFRVLARLPCRHGESS